MCGLCTEIENAIERGDDAEELLKKWHKHARRTCKPSEFTNYWRTVDQVEFVREALNPQPRFTHDLTYAEAYAVLEYVVDATLREHELDFYLGWLEAQFPNANMCDLIYWPDEWFGDASLFRNADGSFKRESELSFDQILAYAMAKSSRKLIDAPSEVLLPFPMPRV